jgi:hypothetical protein
MEISDVPYKAPGDYCQKPLSIVDRCTGNLTRHLEMEHPAVPGSRFFSHCTMNNIRLSITSVDEDKFRVILLASHQTAHVSLPCLSDRGSNLPSSVKVAQP